jgi:hypothetical protein
MTSSNPLENHIFFPDIKSEASEILENIAQICDLPTELAKLTQRYLGFPPKVQVWNGYPGQATLRSQDHKMYILDAEKGPIGPLGIIDQNGSASLYRRPIGLARDRDYIPWNRRREKVILATLVDGMVNTQEVAEHQDVAGNDFRNVNYRILPVDTIVPTYLRDREGKIVKDAQTMVTSDWYVLTLTRSGDLYFNHEYYTGKVRSIVTANHTEFVLVMNKDHEYEYHHNFNLERYRNQEYVSGTIADGRGLISHGKYRGFRTPSIVDKTSSSWLFNHLAAAFLMSDGNIEVGPYETDEDGEYEEIPELLKYAKIPDPLKNHLQEKSNYVERMAASSNHFAALLRLAGAHQEVYIWGRDFSFFTETADLDPCFRRGDLKTGETLRKHIVGIVATRIELYLPIRVNKEEAFAINFEDDTSCIISSRGLCYPTSSKPVRSLYKMADGLLVVTESGHVTLSDYPERLDLRNTFQNHPITRGDGKCENALCDFTVFTRIVHVLRALLSLPLPLSLAMIKNLTRLRDNMSFQPPWDHEAAIYVSLSVLSLICAKFFPDGQPSINAAFEEDLSGSTLQDELDALRALEISGNFDYGHPVSFAINFKGFVLVYSDGTYLASKSARPDSPLHKKIIRAGGIAEIYSDKCYYYAILKDGTITSWYPA